MLKGLRETGLELSRYVLSEIYWPDRVRPGPSPSKSPCLSAISVQAKFGPTASGSREEGEYLDRALKTWLSLQVSTLMVVSNAGQRNVLTKEVTRTDHVSNEAKRCAILIVNVLRTNARFNEIV
jgi:hypothetical protein